MDYSKVLDRSAFLQFFNNSLQPMWVYDYADLKFIAVNPAACKKYGYSIEEFQTMSLYDIRSPEEGGKLRASLEESGAEGRHDLSEVWEHRTKTGEKLLVEVLSSALTLGSIKAGMAILRDVTREHQLSTDLNRLFELSDDLITIRTIDGQLLRCNPSCERILGWPFDEFSKLKQKDFIHPGDFERREAAYKAGFEKEIAVSLKERVLTKDGYCRWIQSTRIIDVDNNRLYGVGRDITEFQEHEERLAVLRSNLAWAQQISHLGSWSLDLETQVFILSDEYYRITGYEPGGYPPTWEHIIATVHPEDRHLVDVGPGPLIRGQWQARIMDVRLVRPNGEVRHVRSFVDTVFSTEGKPIRMNGTIQDITEIKEAEVTKTWLAEIVSSSSDAIIGASLDGLVLSWNKAAERLFGYSADEMVGQHLIRLVPPKRWEEAETILNRLRKGERLPEFETERIDNKGRIFEASFLISPVRSEGNRLVGAAVVCRDISSKKTSENQLASRLAQLTALRRIDATITGSYQIEATLEVIIGEALANVDVDAVCLYINDEDLGLPVLAASSTSRGGPVIGTRLETADLLARKVLSEKRALSSGQVGRSFLGNADIDHELDACDARPLTSKGDLVGVMTVHYQPGVRRPADQFHFLDTLAGQAAIAIESASLFRDLKRSRDELASAYDETIEGWARALDLRDKETEGHSVRVTELTMRLAERLEFPYDTLPHIRRGALLHDIGKLGIPDHILLKPGPLTDDEWVIMRKHPVYSRDILEPIAFLAPALDIPYCHHEKWNGTGYPDGLAGDQIPLAARAFALADVWDALTSNRPYRPAWSIQKAKEYVKWESGRHFDPRLAKIFLELVSEKGD